MRRRILGAIAFLLAGAGLALGQEPAPLPPSPAGEPLAIETEPESSCGYRLAPCPAGSAGPGFWVNGEYLLWWLRDAPLPPIATTVAGQTAVPVALPNAGALGVNGTQVLSPNALDAGSFSGVRLSAGLWLDGEQRIGAEVSGFLLPTRSASFSANSSLANGPALLIPFVNAGANPPVETAFPLGGQGQAAGAISATSRTELWGVAANSVFQALNDGGLTVGLLGGVRYLDLAEDLEMGFRATAPDGSVLAFADGCSTRNQFWGGNLGARAQLRFGSFSASVCGTVALGDMHESVGVLGLTSFSSAAGGFQNAGGFFAQPSNSGRRTEDVFAVVPEAGVQAGYDITGWLRVFCGYEFLYVSDVVRPGDQIDRDINPSQFLGRPLVGPAAPAPLFNHTDFWAQGLTFGLALLF